MQHEKSMRIRQTKEAEARRRLAAQGKHDPRTGGRCDFEEVRKFDLLMEEELRKIST